MVGVGQALSFSDAVDSTPNSSLDDYPERRTVIKNKILAVGRMSRVFHVLREEAERVSELKVATGTGKLPYGTLALGSEGIKEAIHNFDEARKVDIENERMPPSLMDADPLTDDTDMSTPMPALTNTLPSQLAMPVGTGPRTPPSMPMHRRTHSRTSSLGTTMSSPSNRRRSIESTVSMIREALEGRPGNEIGHQNHHFHDDSPSSPRSPSSREPR